MMVHSFRWESIICYTIPYCIFYSRPCTPWRKRRQFRHWRALQKFNPVKLESSKHRLWRVLNALQLSKYPLKAHKLMCKLAAGKVYITLYSLFPSCEQVGRGAWSEAHLISQSLLKPVTLYWCTHTIYTYCTSRRNIRLFQAVELFVCASRCLSKAPNQTVPNGSVQQVAHCDIALRYLILQFTQVRVGGIVCDAPRFPFHGVCSFFHRYMSHAILHWFRKKIVNAKKTATDILLLSMCPVREWRRKGVKRLGFCYLLSKG